MEFKQSKELTDTGTRVYGVEATRPDTIARAELGNLDPQHMDKSVGRAAVDAALELEQDRIPPEEAVLVTDRPDLDSVATMAVLDARSRGEEGIFENPDVAGRIRQIAESDRFSRGQWPGQRELPSRENSWPENTTRPLAAIGSKVADFNAPMDEKVAAARAWLLTGEEPEGYRQQAEAERMDIVEALENGDITIEEREGIAMVTSVHRAGTTLGYYRAPIVVARNPEFRFQGGEPHTKVTIAQYEAGYVDIPGVLEELNTLDSAVDENRRWGGSTAIGGSPQGISTGLSSELIAEVVNRHST